MTTPIIELLKDFENYDPVRGHHSGNLKQHSLWVSYYIQDAIDFPKVSPLGKFWIAIQNLYIKTLHKIDIKKVILCAGILHDIGKGGDHEFNFYAKPGHEKTGYDILNNESEYIFKNNEVFDTKKLINSLNLTNIEYGIIKFLTLNHWSLGHLIIEYDYIKILKSQNIKIISQAAKQIAKDFIKNLQFTDESIHVNHKIVNPSHNLGKIIILMQFMLCCADVMGAQPYCGKSNMLEIFPLNEFSIFKKQCISTNVSMYKKYYYSEIIKNIGHKILQNLHSRSE